MTAPARRALLALFLSISLTAVAQAPIFSDAVPLTHTRYGAFGGEPRLVSNGQELLLFWATDDKLRVTRLVEGQKRAGEPVLDLESAGFDAVWTGTHFLVTALDGQPGAGQWIHARLLTGSGKPVGQPFQIASADGRPRLAFDGTRVLMVYSLAGDLRSMLLRPDGVPATDPHHQTIAALAGRPEASVAASGSGFVVLTALTERIRITTLDANGYAESSIDLPRSGLSSRQVATASNGREVFAVWTNGPAPVESVTIAADGTAGAATPIPGTAGAVAAAASWNGSHWVVTTIAQGRTQTQLIDSPGTPQFPSAQAHAASPVTTAFFRGHTFAAWRGPGAGAPVLVRAVAATGDGQTAAFTAAEQTLQSAAASQDAALAVWSERRDGKRTLHAGVRNSTGGWVENKIGEDEDAPLASSDGRLFLVIKRQDAEWRAVTLDTDAKIVASTPVLTSFTPTGITTDGDGWVIIGTSPQSNVFAVRVMPWGSVSAPILVAEHRDGRKLENPRITSGTDGFFAVWQDTVPAPCAPPCEGYESLLHGTRLSSTLTSLDTQPLEIAPHPATSPDLYFDGARFVIFWLDEGALETRTIRPDAAGSGISRVVGGQIDTGRIRVTDTPFGPAIHASDGEVLFVKNGIASRHGLGRADSHDALVAPGFDVFYIQARTPDEEPYHGSHHLFLQLGSVAPRGSIPTRPEITWGALVDDGHMIVVQWRSPPEPVNGYRIEYRVDDGLWNEFDHWFGPSETEMSIRPWLEGVQYQFRIRAWSDAGVSDYSHAKTVRMLGRRRSVR